MSRIIIRPVIRRDTSPEWVKRGWKQQGVRYHGYYSTTRGLYRGEARRKILGNFDFYIENPPEALKNHSHWACFHLKERDRFWIHFNQNLNNRDTGIIRIESVLNEAFKL